jgi:hypothetical protein
MSGWFRVLHTLKIPYCRLYILCIYHIVGKSTGMSLAEFKDYVPNSGVEFDTLIQQKGASGGPVVDRLGRVIGMHLESWSSVRIREIKGNMSDVEKDSAYNGSFTSIAENYRGFTVALVPAKIPALMALIVRYGGF